MQFVYNKCILWKQNIWSAKNLFQQESKREIELCLYKPQFHTELMLTDDCSRYIGLKLLYMRIGNYATNKDIVIFGEGIVGKWKFGKYYISISFLIIANIGFHLQ